MPTPQEFAGNYLNKIKEGVEIGRLRNEGKYVNDFKEAMQAGLIKKQFTPGAPLTIDNFAQASINNIDAGLNFAQQRIDNPLLNMATGQPLTFEDASGSVSIGPGGVFQAQQSKPGGWGATIDVPNRSVSLNKGMFDVSASLGPTYMPDSTVRIGFDTSRIKAPEFMPEQTGSLQRESLSNRYSPVVYQDPYNGRQPSPAELERDQIIDQYKASDPFWYRVGTGVR
jgi:hypothetical protein